MSATLITGSSGLLGKQISKLFPNALTPSHSKLDITNYKSVLNYIDKCKPDLIIHLAAATSVTRCHEDKKWAWKTNVIGTFNLIHVLKVTRSNAKFFLMSTPCIFNGESDVAHFESDIPDPDSYYGLTKLVQENIVKSAGLKYLIVRANFIARNKWPHKYAFSDRYSYYLFADILAAEIDKLIKNKSLGTFHLRGNKNLSMFDVAKMIDSDVKEITLATYYKRNPNSPILTKFMKLNSRKTLPIQFE